MGRRRLEGKGPTPKAEDRVYHPAHKRKLQAEAERRRAEEARHRTALRAALQLDRGHELIVGRNPVVEAVRSGIPLTRVFMSGALAGDERLGEVVRTATALGAPLVEVSRAELDRMTDGAVHQGVAIDVPPHEYAGLDDLVETQMRGVDDDHPGRGLGEVGDGGVVVIPPDDGVSDRCFICPLPELSCAAADTCLGVSGQQHPDLGIWSNHGGDVPALDDDAPFLLRDDLAHVGGQYPAHLLDRSNRRNHRGDLRLPDLLGHVPAVDAHPGCAGICCDPEISVPHKRSDPVLVVAGNPLPKTLIRHRPVHRARVEITKPKLCCHPPCRR